MRVGIDTGGTFTDISVADHQGNIIQTFKIPSDRLQPISIIMKGLERVRQDYVIDHFFHGTTVGLNALLERSEPEPLLVTTEGFRDVYLLARQSGKRVFLTSRKNILEVAERTGADGRILKEIDACSLLDKLKQHDHPHNIAIALLFSFINPNNEQKLKGLIEEQDPDVYLSLSSAIDPQHREYERISTTIANAYIGPKMKRYFEELKQKLTSLDIHYTTVMTSNGGVTSLDLASAYPVRTLLSGPVAGIVGANSVARDAGIQNVITLDVGGTSADMGVIMNGKVNRITQCEISDIPIRQPIVEIESIGNGGGSIARVKYGTLFVGPDSAGANPGPACYGRGGTEPTVTDAFVVLGWIGREIGGGSVKINMDKAFDVIREKIAGPLNLSVVDSAIGILKVAVQNMASATRRISVDRGMDTRQVTLVPYGGAGPTIGVMVAEELGISTILIPPDPGNLCSSGLLNTDYIDEQWMTSIQPLNDDTLLGIVKDFASLETGVIQNLRHFGYEKEDISVERLLDIRYTGQSYEVSIPFDGITAIGRDIEETFIKEHKRIYGNAAKSALEIVNLRCRGIGRNQHVNIRVVSEPSNEPRLLEKMHFPKENAQVEVPVIHRHSLQSGETVLGGCIVEEAGSTTVVPPNWNLEVLESGSLLLSQKRGVNQGAALQTIHSYGSDTVL